MKIPLFNRLKRRQHRDIALLQDEVVDIVYSIEPKAVLHGGTAVWRCYSSNRFSEDLDFYLGAARGFKGGFAQALESRGLSLQKFKQTRSTIFSRVSGENAEVRFEAALREPKGFVAADYERIDGSRMSVFTLSPEALLAEKIDAYESRRKTKDLYDAFLLSAFAEPDKALSARVKKFIKGVKEPVDESSLKALVFSGAVPSFQQILDALRRRFK